MTANSKPALQASRKVDDLSRHESKHDEAPKHGPRVLPKGGARKDAEGKPARQPKPAPFKK